MKIEIKKKHSVTTFGSLKPGQRFTFVGEGCHGNEYLKLGENSKQPFVAVVLKRVWGMEVGGLVVFDDVDRIEPLDTVLPKTFNDLEVGDVFEHCETVYRKVSDRPFSQVVRLGGRELSIGDLNGFCGGEQTIKYIGALIVSP